MESWSFGFLYVLTSAHVAEEMAFSSGWLGNEQLLKNSFFQIFSNPFLMEVSFFLMIRIVFSSLKRQSYLSIDQLKKNW